MAMNSIRCPVLRGRVTQVTDLEGHVTQVICAEYQADGSCRLKQAMREGGPLSRLLERMSERGVSTPGAACVLRIA